MKKVLFSLSVFAVVLFAAQSCTKNSNIESPSVEVADYSNSNDEYEEIEAPDNDDSDPIGYEPEALVATVTGGTKVSMLEDADNTCQEFKYAKPGTSPSWTPSTKVGKGANAVTFTVVLAGLPVGSSKVDSIINTNSSTGATAAVDKVAKVGGRLIVSNVTPDATDTTKCTFKLSAETDEFKAGSATCKIYYHVTKAGVSTVKYKSVTIKAIGVSATGKTFSTQRWGFDAAGGAAAKYTATPTTFDTSGTGNFAPVIGSVVCFGPSKRGVIDSVSISAPLATASAATKAKGDKVFFRYVMYNSKCTSTKKIGKVTVYKKLLPTTKVLYTDGPALSGFVQ